MIAFKTTSNNKLTLVITDKTKLKAFDITHNQIRPIETLSPGFYIVANKDIKSDFVTLQHYETNKISTVLSNHISYCFLRETVSFC